LCGSVLQRNKDCDMIEWGKKIVGRKRDRHTGEAREQDRERERERETDRERERESKREISIACVFKERDDGWFQRGDSEEYTNDTGHSLFCHRALTLQGCLAEET